MRWEGEDVERKGMYRTGRRERRESRGREEEGEGRTVPPCFVNLGYGPVNSFQMIEMSR